MEQIRRVVFVCWGNTSRSPAAEYIAKDKAIKRGLDVEFASAGFDPPFSDPSIDMYRASRRLGIPLPSGLSSKMSSALRELGYQSPKQHTPTKVTPQFLQGSDLVLCFERYQVERARKLIGGEPSYVHTLPEYAGFPEQEIPDLDELIEDTPLSWVVKHLPFWSLRWPLYDRIGHVHSRDETAVLEVHKRLAQMIEGYVEQAIEKIAKTNLG